MTELIIALIGLLTTVGAWLVSGRKNKAETLAVELQNVQQVVKLWKDLTDELTRKVTALEKEIVKLRKELEDIERANQKKCETCKYKKAYENR
jgi:cell division protein FtsB